MVNIQLQVSEEIIGKLGVLAVAARFQKEIETEKMKILAQDIQQGILVAGINEDDLVNEARQNAWLTFKTTFLKNISL